MTQKNSYTLKLSKEDEAKLYAMFEDEMVLTPPPYSKWQCKVENCSITCYESGKTLFQGKDAYVYASAYLEEEDTNMIYPQAGSDEVGTGDYFGPVCVCACYLDESQASLLESLDIKDSKQLTDDKILEIAPTLIKELKYSLLILNNEKYNEVHESSNMNEIKAKLHNQAYVNLQKKVPLPKFKVVDQFAKESLYYNYLRNEKEVIGQIHFETKAENKYPSVAMASIIARYAFIQSMNAMNEQYNTNFPYGAGEAVDVFAKDFVQKYGKEELKKVAKYHFKNTEKIDQI